MVGPPGAPAGVAGLSLPACAGFVSWAGAGLVCVAAAAVAPAADAIAGLAAWPTLTVFSSLASAGPVVGLGSRLGRLRSIARRRTGLGGRGLRGGLTGLRGTALPLRRGGLRDRLAGLRGPLGLCGRGLRDGLAGLRAALRLRAGGLRHRLAGLRGALRSAGCGAGCPGTGVACWAPACCAG